MIVLKNLVLYVNFPILGVYFVFRIFFRVCFVFRFRVLVFVSIYTKHETRNTKHEVFVFRVPISTLKDSKIYLILFCSISLWQYFDPEHLLFFLGTIIIILLLIKYENTRIYSIIRLFSSIQIAAAIVPDEKLPRSSNA